MLAGSIDRLPIVYMSLRLTNTAALQDLVAFSRAVQRYHDMVSEVRGSNECKFLLQLRQAWEDGDEQTYNAIYDRYKAVGATLSDWQKRTVEKGLESIKGGGDDFA